MAAEPDDTIENIENYAAGAEKDVALPDNVSDDLNNAATGPHPVSINASDSAGTKNQPEDQLAIEAFKHLKSIFHRHFHNAMVEAGKYIITRFYNDDPIAALAKNKGEEQPKSIKKLIDMLRSASKSADGNVPSLAWFYNAVNLAAHEEICEQEGFQTFRKLGHSHKLQLLHFPKLKGIPADEIREDISDIFEEKEQLAEYAYENRLSVRDLKKRIKDQYPSNEIDLTELPPLNDLKGIERSDLVKLRNKANDKIEENQRVIALYGKSVQKLDSLLSEYGDKLKKGKGRFRDWTKPGNNINICTGCENDCLYCYAKSMAQRWNQVKPDKWSHMKIRQADVDKARKLHDGLVGFPTSHDITPSNIDAYLTVLGKLLRTGNEVLIVTKPRLECIKKICNASSFFKDKILFRFTIGAMTDDILGFWEPNAPTYQERKDCLQYAYQNGFRTSVSMEPLLAMDQVHEMIAEFRPLVGDKIWIGTMNHLTEMKKDADKALKDKVDQIEKAQSPQALKALYDVYKYDSRIKWKTDALKAIHIDENNDEAQQKLNSMESGELSASMPAAAMAADLN